MTAIEMIKTGTDDLFDYYEADFKSPYTRICYCFLLDDGKEKLYYYAAAFHKELPFERWLYYQLAYNRKEDIACVPNWTKNAVMYQIFPDSFATSKRFISNKPLTIENKCGLISKSKRGGTIKGITENLDYIQDLGCNCIYINPIFTAVEYHKYDTTDYYSIDPCFGEEEDFKVLVKKAHQMGMKIILDGVFNHCGKGFFAFQDVLRNGEKSKYKDWFYRIEFPVKDTYPPNYACFAYVENMPKLNTGNKEVIDYFCKVGQYWINEFGIDGWRLDVANEINRDFWREFRKAIKAVNNEAILLAEIWEDSEIWLQGDMFDSSMNYRFRKICTDFFAKANSTVDEFDEGIHYMMQRYKKQITYAQMNLLDSHDVSRFLSLCNGDKEKLKLAVFFMLLFPGMPSVFCGDELGIEGIEEKDYRECMPWTQKYQEKDSLFNFYKQIIKVRNDNIDIFSGTFSTVLKDNMNKVYGYMLKASSGTIIVVLNNSKKKVTADIALKESIINARALLDGSTIKKDDKSIEIQLSPMSGQVIML